MPTLADLGLRLFLEAAFAAVTPGITGLTFVLDDAGQGLLDTGQLAGADTWTDITAQLRDVRASRPWTRQQGPVWQAQAGTLTATLRNSDGRFDPDNAAGPYAGSLRPMVPVRLRATWAGREYFLFSGFVTSWADAGLNVPGYAETVLSASDAFYVLAGITLAAAAPAGANELSGARVSRVLNAAGWYGDGAKRKIGAGQSQLQATAMGDTALNLLQLAASSEVGELYMRGDGAVVFRDRHALLTETRSAAVQGVFGDAAGTVHPAGAELAYDALTRLNDDTTMANDIQVTRAGGTLQEAQSAASVGTFLFPRTYAPPQPVITTDAEALQQAQWLLTVAQGSENRFEQLALAPLRDPANLAPHALGREPGDRIEVWRRPPGFPVVTLYGAPGTLPVHGPGTAAMPVTATGHTFAAVPVPGWGFGAGAAVFYAAALPGGQVALTTVPLTENELQPTADHAELAVFTPPALNPSAAGPQPAFQRLVIPTSGGSLTAVEPGHAIGGTDAGGGDMQIIAGRPVFTCEGYYFGWSIPSTGLYPALGFLRNLSGTWAYDQASSLTGDQWEATNPTAFATLQPGGITAGNGASYWSPRSPGQMAVLPNSGRLVVGHYFGTGSFTSGAISVSDASGNLLAAYQIPNIVPTDGTTLTTCAVRDVEADPSSAVNDERFVVIYDAFGTGSIQGCFQEFSYNESTRVIAPVSVPTCPADTTGGSPARVRPSFAFFGPDGTLYMSCGNGLNSANMSVYLKHAGGRNTVINAPVFTGWPTASWPTPVRPDYSLGFPVAQGLGPLAGPLATDPVTGAVLVPSGGSRVAAAVPAAAGIGSLGPNLLPPLAAGFETPNMLTDDDSRFAASLGTWVPFVATLARSASPPVAPPAGTAAGQMTTALGSMTCNSGFYPVAANTSYLLVVNFLAAAAARTMECWIQWQDSGGTVISSSAHGTGTDNAATWTPVTTGPVTSPNGAARAVLFVQGDAVAAGEVHYFAANALYCLDPAATGWAGFATGIALTADQALDGTFSLAITALFAGLQAAISPKALVAGGREYLAKASFRAKTAAEACKLTVAFQDSTGNNIGFPADGTLAVTDTTTGWAEAWCGALAPPGAVTAQVNLEPTAAAAGEVHYADRVSLQAQPWTCPPACDFGETLLRSAGYSVTSGRPAVTGGYLYLPVATTFTPAEQAAYSTSYIPDTAHPQYLAAISIAQFLAGGYGAVFKDCFIRGIEHQLTPDGAWATTWTLQDATRYADFLTLDSAAAGRLDTGHLAY